MPTVWCQTCQHSDGLTAKLKSGYERVISWRRTLQAPTTKESSEISSTVEEQQLSSTYISNIMSALKQVTNFTLRTVNMFGQKLWFELPTAESHVWIISKNKGTDFTASHIVWFAVLVCFSAHSATTNASLFHTPAGGEDERRRSHKIWPTICTHTHILIDISSILFRVSAAIMFPNYLPCNLAISLCVFPGFCWDTCCNAIMIAIEEDYRWQSHTWLTRVSSVFLEMGA